MNYRQIELSFDRDCQLCRNNWDFFYNIQHLCEFIHRFTYARICKMKIPTDGNYNCVFFKLSDCKEPRYDIFDIYHNLYVYMPFGEEGMRRLIATKDGVERTEFFLSLLEEGYRLAKQYTNTFPLDELMAIHKEFRDGGYISEWSCSKKRSFRKLGIKVYFYNKLTMYEYQFIMVVTDLNGNEIARAPIDYTLPHWMWHVGRHSKITVENNLMVFYDTIGKRVIEVDIKGLPQGKIVSHMIEEGVFTDKDKESIEKGRNWGKELRW